MSGPKSRKTNVLMITQKMDKDDDILGFMHKWAEKLAERVGELHVTALSVGRHELPPNAHVHSLGKEEGAGKLKRLFRLYSTALRLLSRGKADVIFVHMNQIYVFLLYPLAKLFGKPIVLWKTHGNLPWRVRAAARLCDAVATASEESFAVETSKRRVLGHGIDTSVFKPRGKKRGSGGPGEEKTILTAGRISPVKDYDCLTEAMAILAGREDAPNLRLDIAGGSATSADREYMKELRKKVGKLELDERVRFLGSVPHAEMPGLYRGCDAFVSASRTGSIDKAVLEAMACGRPALTSNDAFGPVLKGSEELLMFSGPEDLAVKLERVLNLSPKERAELGKRLRETVVKDHNLDRLANRICALFRELSG